MKALFRLMLTLALAFSATFLVVKFTGIFSIEKIESWLHRASEINDLYIIAIVVILLFLDLFIAVPTLSIMLLSGYFLGHYTGAMAAIIGVTLAGSSGYIISYFYGEKLEKVIVKKENERVQLRQQFQQYGVVMILLSRAVPIFPEVTACLSGITKWPFRKFICVWSLSSIPYAFIATYAGSISSLENPKPAIYTAIMLTAVLWLAWFVFKLLSSKKVKSEVSNT